MSGWKGEGEEMVWSCDEDDFIKRIYKDRIEGEGVGMDRWGGSTEWMNTEEKEYA